MISTVPPFICRPFRNQKDGERLDEEGPGRSHGGGLLKVVILLFNNDRGKQ